MGAKRIGEPLEVGPAPAVFEHGEGHADERLGERGAWREAIEHDPASVMGEDRGRARSGAPGEAMDG